MAQAMMQQQPQQQERSVLGTLLERMQAIGSDQEAMQNAVRLFERMGEDNLAEDQEDDNLRSIGQRVVREYKLDKNSRGEWEERQQEYVETAKQVTEEKSYPWPGAANVKYPLLTEAALEFNARAYPEIVQGNNVVKSQVVGSDEDGEKQKRGDRVEKYQNYQLLHEMEDWSEGMDRLLLILPIVGTCFKKTYYDATLMRPVSDLVPAENLVINFDAPSMARAPRITQEFWLYKHEIEERKRSEVFRDVDLRLPQDSDGDEDAPHKFLEQHRREDIDGDGYPEPIIVVVHCDSGTVMRIVANYEEDGIDVDVRTGEVVRLEPVKYFTKYGFIPNPDSSIYDLGFGDLLRSLQGSIDTTVNQMLDAGHLQNSNFFFYGRGARMKSGEKKIAPGRGVPVETNGGSLRENIYVPNFSGPSSVLFNLLGMLTEAGTSITSVKGVMQGDMPANAQPTTVMALIEQGMKKFGAVYKRVHRALGEEVQKLYRINSKYLDPEKYFRTLDDSEPMQIMAEDFDNEHVDIVPVSDPTVLSDQHRLAKAQYLQQFVGDPTLDHQALLKRILEAGKIEDIDDLWAQQPPQPAPEEQAKMMEADIKQREMDLKEKMAPFERLKTYSEALNELSNVEDKEAEQNRETAKMIMDFMRQEVEEMNGQQGAVGGVAGQPGNAGGHGVPQGRGPAQ